MVSSRGLAFRVGLGVDVENKRLNGCRVITRGEAVGHGVWVDDLTLQQVEALGKAGVIKCRFAHPSESREPLSWYIGSWRSWQRDKDSIRADLVLWPGASESPEASNDVIAYVLRRAAEHPESLGVSIVFMRDYEAEDEFMRLHQGPHGGFKSPDRANVQNFPHLRIAGLLAADIVDSAAANPSLFRRLAAGKVVGGRRVKAVKQPAPLTAQELEQLKAVPRALQATAMRIACDRRMPVHELVRAALIIGAPAPEPGRAPEGPFMATVRRIIVDESQPWASAVRKAIVLHPELYRLHRIGEA